MQSAWTGSLKPRSELFLISRTRLLQSAEFRIAGRVYVSRALRARLLQVGFLTHGGRDEVAVRADHSELVSPGRNSLI